MARCNFCGTEFSNRQAVRAHLKGCAAYRARAFQREPIDNAPHKATLLKGEPKYSIPQLR